MCGPTIKQASDPSTTPRKKKPKMTGHPEGEQRAIGAPSRVRRVGWTFLARRDWRQPLTITLAVVGKGPDAWVEVRTRSSKKRFPIDTCLLVLAAEVNSRTEGCEEPHRSSRAMAAEFHGVERVGRVFNTQVS